jgi:hypothetical protein
MRPDNFAKPCCAPATTVFFISTRSSEIVGSFCWASDWARLRSSFWSDAASSRELNCGRCLDQLWFGLAVHRSESVVVGFDSRLLR